MVKLTKREILNSLSSTDSNSAIEYILQKLNVSISSLQNEDIDRLQRAISRLKSKRDTKYEAASRKKCRFEQKNAEWLDSEFSIPKFSIDIEKEKASGSRSGRPPLPFCEKSARSQRRDAALISAHHQNDPLKLLMACRHASRLAGKKDLCSVLQEISSPTRAAKVRRLMNEPKTFISKLTADEALGYLLERNFSKDDYISMRLLTKSRGADIFPAYEHVRAAKEKCRPPKEDISFTEVSAEVSLQALLNHTAIRLIELQSEVVFHIVTDSGKSEVEAVLMCSWGFDGSSGHSAYKQTYADKPAKMSDENIFATTVIPLRLQTANNVVIWNNRTSQSSRFCRPIKIEYVKESADLIIKQKKAVEDKIEQLQSVEISLDNIKVRIHFSLFMTLVDGKVLNIITNTKSMQTCPICHAVPSKFNDLSNKDKGIFDPNPNSLQYGISPLHCWIRFFECCLHIAYRLTVKKWQIRSAKDKEEFAKRKREIQAILWSKFGLRVDLPKVGGSGTTNDGNTARRAFEKPDDFADCLGLDKQLISNFKFILISLSCHLPIDVNRFDILCTSTAKLFVQLYPWYNMPSSVHKVLIHGADIIKYSKLPLGMLGEEASESRNKHYKNYRLSHSRKHNRLCNIQDLFNRVMDTSDPLISSMNLSSRLQKSSKRKQLPLPAEVCNLLALPKLNSDSESDTDADELEDVSGLQETFELLDEVQLTDEEGECETEPKY